jgi:hypothetical protein
MFEKQYIIFGKSFIVKGFIIAGVVGNIQKGLQYLDDEIFK